MPVLDDFRWWYNMFILPQRRDLVHLFFLTPLNLFFIPSWKDLPVTLSLSLFNLMWFGCYYGHLHFFCRFPHMCITGLLPRKVLLIQHLNWEEIPTFPEVIWGIILPSRYKSSFWTLKINITCNNYRQLHGMDVARICTSHAIRESNPEPCHYTKNAQVLLLGPVQFGFTQF